MGGGLPDLDLTTLLFVLAGYLAGSIPTGYWLVRALRGEDIRKVGSGNIGATNVWRTYGARLGAPVMALDVAKGFVPALLATIFVGHLAGVLAGGAAMLGHWRPVFMRFARREGRGDLRRRVPRCGPGGRRNRGGGVDPRLRGLPLRVGASIAAALSLPVTAVALGEPWPVDVFAGIAALAVLVLHRANITRLRAGTETRFRFRRTASAGQ